MIYSPRVLMIVHDPIVDTRGTRLHQHMRWNNPYALATQYIADMAYASHGRVQYQVVKTIDAPWFPVKIDGFRYDATSYLRGWQRRDMHHPDALDYHARIAQFDLVSRRAAGEFDEVWCFSFPYAGEYESIMIGPQAIWCNAPPIMLPDATHNFVMMGFNFERDVGCMLENFGHRVESMMHAVYQRLPHTHNYWREFSQYDAIAPQQAGCGNVHFAPNSRHDYDWGHSAPVWSYCDRWRDFPYTIDAPARTVDCDEWGSGDMRAHHIWWLQHLPRHAGLVDGVWGDWWHYCLTFDWLTQ
jgi:hypothetical protein